MINRSTKDGQAVHKNTIVILFAVGFFCILIFVSLLGENNKANTAVIRFFKNIKKNEYERAYKDLSSDAFSDSFKTTSFSDFAFLLELSLLSKFDLLGIDDYQIEAKRNTFWFPYFSDKRLELSIRLEKKSANILQLLSGIGRKPYLQGIFTLERIKGVWQICEIKTEGPPIGNIFSELREKLNNNNFYVKTKDGFILHPFEYNEKKMLPVDRYLYNYLLLKALQTI